MEDQSPYRQPTHESEVTLADIFLSVQAYVHHLIRNWYWFVAAAVIGAIAAFAFVKFQTIDYIAEITFVANEESQRGGNSMLASTLASFGLSGGSGSETSSYSKIIALSQSRRIQYKSLLDTVLLDGENDLLINHISRIYNLQNEWEVDEPVHFTDQPPDSMDLVRRQYLKRIYNMITKAKKPLYSISFDNATQMINMNAETIDQDLSIALVYSLYDNLNAFYVLQSTAKGQETVNTLTRRKDSLENVLQKQQASLAYATDRSRGMTYQSQQTNRVDLTVDLNITKTMYMEVVKNLEVSRFSLENIRPVFTIIDYPLKPLPTNRKKPVRYMVIFVIVGCVMVGMMLVIGKMYRDVMKNANKTYPQ